MPSIALNTFKGGICPSLHKEITSEKEFSNLSIPQVCYIPLQQHTGNPAVPVVKTGDIVQEGQLIGKSDGLISVNVHSSIPGKVIDIKDHPTAGSGKGKCIVIEADGKFSSSGKPREKISWQNINREILIGRIAEAGIAGMGGEAFPTSVKLSGSKNKKINYLIINCAESEPYLTADDMLIRTFSEEIIEGIQIILKILGIEKACIGIENNKKKSIQKLREAIENHSLKECFQVYTLKAKYPQGAEKLLIYSIFRKEVPSGKIPIDINVMVLNISTVFAVREACVLGKPLFERFVTISGKIINNPGNYKIRIGTRISDIVEECGGLKENPVKIIFGGPLRGISVQSLDVPVIKSTSAVLFLSKKESRPEIYRPCVRCGRCATACPIKLLPFELTNAIVSECNDVSRLGIYDCIMCGACSYVCPSGRPLAQIINSANESLRIKTAEY